MNASSVVVTAQSRGKVKLHTVVVYRMVVHMAVGAAVPTEAVVGHTVRTVAVAHKVAAGAVHSTLGVPDPLAVARKVVAVVHRAAVVAAVGLDHMT